MPDVIVNKKLLDGKGGISIHLLSNASDGTGESAQIKVNISDLNGAPTKVKINRIKWAVAPGMFVDVLFDHTADDRVVTLVGNGELGRNDIAGGLIDPDSGGETGDILFTTGGQATGDGYTILLEVEAVPDTA